MPEHAVANARLFDGGAADQQGGNREQRHVIVRSIGVKVAKALQS